MSSSASAAASSVEVESGDVVRLILQYLREHNLAKSAEMLTQETGVTLNTVENMDVFVSDIKGGRWDAVLKVVAHLKVPDSALFDLYEQIVIELTELRELGSARSVLRNTSPMQHLKATAPERYLKLEALVGKTFFDPSEAYGEGNTRDKRRQAIADTLSKEVLVVPPSRLLSLLQQSLRWQLHTGILPPGAKLDVFRGKASIVEREEEAYPTKFSHSIKFGKSSHCECGVFSPDGEFFVTGSVDGFIEVWNYMTGKLRKDLQFQKEENFMMMETAVLSLAFTRDSEMLASGSQGGQVKVWKVVSGQCLRTFEHAHSQGVTSVAFSKDNSQILTASFDHLVRIHGLKSGKTLKEFRGHTSFVNSACFSGENEVISASSDGTVKIWNSRTSDCIHTFNSMVPDSSLPVTVNSVQCLPRTPDNILVCNRSNTLTIINTKGAIVKTFSSGQQANGAFIACIISPRGDWIYAVAEDKTLYCFNAASASLEQTLKVHDADVIGLVHHPLQNLLATYAEDGLVKIWKP